MQKLVITMYDDEDETTISCEKDVITWVDAHKVFFRMLRGAGYVINGANYINAIDEDVTELVEAEAGDGGVKQDDDVYVGGGGFLTGDDDV